MARKSRITKSPVKAVFRSQVPYRAGIYGRLSSEESGQDSLAVQLELLRSFVEQHTDMELVDSYSDFGFSGSNFDRPDYHRLMADVDAGRVNCIIVKDLSRLGRNFIETGELIEKTFPAKGVRFIAVTDSFDTAKGDGMEALIASVKNLINDVYAKDISKKIRATLRTKQRNGEYIGGFGPYGYMKDPEDKHHLIINPDTAPVVRRIFQMFVDGEAIQNIVLTLDSENIPPGRRYWYEQGKSRAESWKNSKWTKGGVKLILTNRMYLGDMVQGLMRQNLCEHAPRQRMDEKDYIIVPGTHEPIIDRETFDRAQERLETNRKVNKRNDPERVALRQTEVNLLSKRIRCACCGGNVSHRIKYNGNKIETSYYCCHRHQTYGNTGCTNNTSLSRKKTESAVLKTIQAEILQFMDESMLPRGGAAESKEADELAAVGKELDRMKKRVSELYTDYAEGLLSREDYISIREQFTEQRKALQDRIDRLHKELEAMRVREDGSPQVSYLKKQLKAETLTQELVDAFVERVLLGADRNVEVVLKGRDKLFSDLEVLL